MSFHSSSDSWLPGCSRFGMILLLVNRHGKGRPQVALVHLPLASSGESLLDSDGLADDVLVVHRQASCVSHQLDQCPVILWILAIRGFEPHGEFKQIADGDRL